MAVIEGLHRVPLRFPRSPRELFQVLALQESSGGLEALLDRIDFSGVTPGMIYNLVHARAPESPNVAVPSPGYNPRQHLLAAVRSSEFRMRTLRNILRAFPELRRDVFLHIPKCAGTDLILNVAPSRLALPHTLTDEGWISTDDFLTAIGRLACAIPFYDEIFVYGHLELTDYVRNVGVNVRDSFFTVLRDPADLLLSQANYAVGRLRQDPAGNDPDAAEILRCLDLPRLPDTLTSTDLKRLAVRCLLDPRISQPNRTCFYLGDHDSPRYHHAMQHLIIYDVEVSATSHYARFLRERWNIASSSTRHNQSVAFLTRTEAMRFFSDRVREAIAEDQKLYDVVQWALGKTGKASVSGTEIASLAGPALLGDFPATVSSRKPGDRGATPITVVQGEDPVERYLSPLPQDLIADDRRTAEIAAISFVEGGNSAEFVLAGWSPVERRHTWSCDTRAALEIPHPDDGAEFVLQLEATPYTSGDRLPQQTVEIVVNGTRLEPAKLKRPAVVEWELPRAALDGRGSIKIEFELPNAARPMDVAGDPDDRLLGIAVRAVRLLRIGAGKKVVSAPARPKPAVSISTPAPATGGRADADTALKDLMMSFESLGENCEFGLVQRRCGAEPIGLLRFASTPYPKLIAALEHGFQGMGAPGMLEIEIAASGREYMVADKRFGMLYHAWVDVGEKPPEEILERELRRVPFLVRKLKEDLATGEKLFVFHGMDPLTVPQAVRLSDAMQRLGNNTLLWMELADRDNPPGSVRAIKPGLLKGHMDRFAPGENAHDLSLETWIAVCKHAMSVAQPANV